MKEKRGRSKDINSLVEGLSEVFYYNENSPSGLSWKINRYGGRYYKKLLCQKDSLAGCKTKSGYWLISYKNKRYLAHRIIWLIVNKEIDLKYIDHIDGDGYNNNVSNLRLVTSEINGRNCKKSKNNKTGYNGISHCTTLRSNGVRTNAYTVSILVKTGVIRNKSFSCIKYGEEEALRLAIYYRDLFLEEAKINNTGYTDRHGK